MNRLYRAYVGLLNAPQNANGWRAISLERFGAFEVRLIEFADTGVADEADIWIELYCHDTQSSLDSCRCQGLDAAEPLAEQLVSRAQSLSRSQSASGLP